MKMANPKKRAISPKLIYYFLFLLATVAFLIAFSFALAFSQKEKTQFISKIGKLESQKIDLEEKLISLSQEFSQLKNEDQYKRNNELETTIKNIEKTYNQAVDVYENLLSLKEKTAKTQPQDEKFAQSLDLLSQRNYASASATLTQLNQEIEKEKEKIATQFVIPTNVPVNNSPPGSGYSRQQVATDVGNFMVSLVAADLNSTRVIVDTASDSDCTDNCPVLPLATYVSRNGAFAGVNGSYFCPATYPDCTSKKNSFDTLLMNKNKVYFNSANNVYSTVPTAIFYGNTARFVAQSMEWGRDTGVDSVIANYPLLTFNSQIAFTGDDKTKHSAKGGRSFIAVTGSTVYIGVIHSATVAEAAKVAHALNLNHALNLDDGGSTALWSGGYKVGPGRDLPNAVLLVRK